MIPLHKEKLDFFLKHGHLDFIKEEDKAAAKEPFESKAKFTPKSLAKVKKLEKVQ